VHSEDSRGHDSSPGRYTRGYSFLGRSPEGTTVRPSDSQVGISSSGGLPSALLSTWMTRERVFGPRQCSRGHYVPPERHTRRYSVLGRPPEITTLHPSALLSAQVTRRHGFDAREPSREQDTWSRRHKTMSCVAPILRLVPRRSFATKPTLQCGGLARTNPLFSVAREWTRGPTNF
jgi:hypothetical protein